MFQYGQLHFSFFVFGNHHLLFYWIIWICLTVYLKVASKSLKKFFSTYLKSSLLVSVAVLQNLFFYGIPCSARRNYSLKSFPVPIGWREHFALKHKVSPFPSTVLLSWHNTAILHLLIISTISQCLWYCGIPWALFLQQINQCVNEGHSSSLHQAPKDFANINAAEERNLEFRNQSL